MAVFAKGRQRSWPLALNVPQNLLVSESAKVRPVTS